MQYGNRYFVRREQCWDGTYVWFVADSERSASWRADCVGRQFKAERTAKNNCERANRDWQRFLHKAAAHGT